VLAVALIVPSAAPAATVIGQTDADVATPPASQCFSINPGAFIDGAQDATLPPNIYAVPGPGVITSWSTLADTAPAASDQGDSLAMRVYSRGAGNVLTPIAESGPITLQVPFLHNTPARIPVHGGEIIGLRIAGYGPDGVSACRRAGAPLNNPGDRVLAAFPAVPVGQPALYTLNAVQTRLDVSAVLEPDADGDGFGDETQDVSIVSVPKKKTKKKKAVFGLAGAGTIQCRLDKQAFTPCATGITFKKLKPRKHTFRVITTGPTGETTPEIAFSWRVTGK
jgi:hypothetical protein